VTELPTSSWIEKRIDLAAGVIERIQTSRKCNLIMIRNPSLTNRIYMDGGAAVSATRYEGFAEVDGWGVFVRPFDIGSLYLFSAAAISSVTVREIYTDDPFLYLQNYVKSPLDSVIVSASALPAGASTEATLTDVKTAVEAMQLQLALAGGLPVAVSGSYQQVDAVIADEGTASSEIDFRNFKYLSFLMPAGWDAATLTIYGSMTAGGTKVAITNDAGVAFPAMTVAVDKIYTVDVHALKLASVPFLSLVASAAQMGGPRTIKCFMKA